VAKVHADEIVAVEAEMRQRQAKYEERLLSQAAERAAADADALERRAAALEGKAAKAREAEVELEAKAEAARCAAKARLQRNARERKLREKEEERQMMQSVAAKAEALKLLNEERKQKQVESKQRWEQADQVRKIILNDRAKTEAQARQKREAAERARQEKAAEEKAAAAAEAAAERSRQAELHEEARKGAEARARAVTRAKAKAAAEEERRSRQEAEQRMLVLKVGLTGSRPTPRGGEVGGDGGSGGANGGSGGGKLPFSRAELERQQAARQEAIFQAARRRQAKGEELLNWSQQRRQGAFAEDEALQQLMREQPLLPLRELPPAAGGNAPAARAVSCPAKASRSAAQQGQGSGGLLSMPSFAARRKGQVCDGWSAWGGKG
jgi:hypothetical protein